MKVYIASAMFIDYDIERISKMEDLLESRGYEVYSPRRDGIMLTPDASQEDRLKVFEENATNVYDCDLMVAIISRKDTGTCVEIGMQYMKWRSKINDLRKLQSEDPEILTRRDLQLLSQETPRLITFSDSDESLNVMLLGAVLRHCSSWEELSEYLDYIDKVGLEFAKRDTDSISHVKVY